MGETKDRGSKHRWWPSGSLLLLLAACGAADAPRENVLLVSIDTLRAGHLGCYGYERDTSPVLDAFAAEATRFADALAPSPWTLASHAGLFTGRHPHELGVRDHRQGLPESVPLLAERLREAGWQTAALVDSAPRGFLGGERGFARGFETYRHAPFADGPYRYDVRATVEEGLRWIEARDRSRPFFLFLHTKSVHTTPLGEGAQELVRESQAPYHKPLPYRTRYLPHGERFDWNDGAENVGVGYLRDLNERIAAGEDVVAELPAERLEELVALYDGGIRYTDEALGVLLEALDEAGLAGETVVVVTSDHGEAFREHDLLLHKEVYGPLLHVPLLVRDVPGGPYGRGVVVETPVSLLDVAPTILARVGIAPIGSAQVLPREDPPRDRSQGERPFFFAFEYAPDHFYEAGALVEGPWKLVLSRLGDGELRRELFHLGEDPGEAAPRHDQEARAERMQARLRGWLEAEPRANAEEIDLDAGSLQDLKDLGYATGSAAPGE